MVTARATTSALRRANARDCLLALRDAGTSDGALTLAELAAATGLSRPTVDAVLEELSAAGIVSAAPAASTGGAGRPARRVRFEASAGAVAALDIGTRAVRCLVADAAGTEIARSEVTTVPGEDLLPTLVRAVRETGTDPAALGIAVPGILTPEGRIARSLAVEGLDGRDLAGELSAALDRPVTAENDIKLAALAEHHLGERTGSMVLLQLGRRISVAVVLDGKILQGAHRLAGELGSQRGMRWTDRSERGRLTWSTGDDARPLLERAADGDPEARTEIAEFCAQIAPRLATVLLTVDPERVVVGGGLSRAGETLLDPLRTAVGRLLMTAHLPQVVPARLTIDGALVGALGLAFDLASVPITGVEDVPAPWHRLA